MYKYFMRRMCSMHTLNLGIMQNLAAEGILCLTDHNVYSSSECMKQQLHACFNQFKQWCSRSGISTSQRRFTPASLHLNVKPPDYPFLGAKAYNCRVVTAWLAASQLLSASTRNSPVLGSFNLEVILWGSVSQEALTCASTQTILSRQLATETGDEHRRRQHRTHLVVSTVHL